MSSLLQLRQVTHFYGRHCALRDVDLELAPGAIGLVGQNGAGKSTLMQILLGLIRPTAGDAIVLGQSVRKASVALRSRVGFMPERDALVSGLNGIEYAALSGELCGMPRRQALRRAHETLSYLGLEDARYRRLDEYSLGMVQRLKLAATLVHDPDLLLLDEPTSGLDPQGRAAMLALLETLAARPGKSLVLSSHLLGDIERVCHTVVILNQGQLASVGPLNDLRATRPRSYRLCWDGAGESFLAALRVAGVEVRAAEAADQARVVVPVQWQTHQLFALAQQQQVTLRLLEPEEEDLEAAYHRIIGRATAERGSAAALTRINPT